MIMASDNNKTVASTSAIAKGHHEDILSANECDFGDCGKGGGGDGGDDWRVGGGDSSGEAHHITQNRCQFFFVDTII